MTQLIGCASTEPLGFPAFFRAVYSRWSIVQPAQLATALNNIVGQVQESQLATPVNDPTPIDTTRSAVLRVAVVQTAQAVTVAHLVNALRVPPVAFGLLPDLPIQLVSVERISEGTAYDDGANDVIRQQQDASDADPLGSIEHILDLILALVVVGLVVYVGVRVSRAIRGR